MDGSTDPFVKYADDHTRYTLSELRKILKDRGIIEVKKTTMEWWVKVGVKNSHGKMTKLSAPRVGWRRYSSCAKVIAFLRASE